MEPIALWVLIPFILMLLGIAAAPLIVPDWWEKNINKIFYSLLLAVPTIAYLVSIARKDCLFNKCRLKLKLRKRIY